MEKTYRLLEHTKPMTRQEIKALYDGCWVYIVNARFTEGHGFIDGIPVVAGTTAYDGVEDGIYEQFKDPRYGNRYGMVLLHDKFLSSLTSSSRRQAV